MLLCRSPAAAPALRFQQESADFQQFIYILHSLTADEEEIKISSMTTETLMHLIPTMSGFHEQK